MTYSDVILSHRTSTLSNGRASMGFMLPVSTPCNAIVYGSGKIPLAKMMRYGVLLDLAGVIVIIAFVKLLLPLVR